MKSLSKIQALDLNPGDQLLLKLGTSFINETITLEGQKGSLSLPMRI
jgi:hypothetical protein